MKESLALDDSRSKSPLRSDTSSFANLDGCGDGEALPPVELLAVGSLFHAIKEILPGLTRETNSGSYFVPGKIDKESLCNHTKRIGELTLGKESEFERLAPHVFVRIAQFHDTNMPLFPSLRHLCIVAASSSLDLLHVLLSPALMTLELTAIPSDDPHYASLLSFLECAIDEAPGLSTLILGPGQFQDKILDISVKYKNLGRLELLGVGITITHQFIHDIGSLQHLEKFVLRDNGTSTYERSPAVEDLKPKEVLHDPFIGFNYGLSQPVKEEFQPSSPFSFAFRPTPPLESTVPAPKKDPVDAAANVVSSLFPALRTFEVDGPFDLIEDLVAKVGSSDLRALSIDVTKPLARLVEDLEDSWDTWGAPSKRKPKKTSFGSSRPPSSLAQNLADIVSLLKRSIHKWPNSLESVSFKNAHTRSLLLPSDIFGNLLLRPNMIRLEISGMLIGSMESTLRRLPEVGNSKLEELHLPMHSTAPSIPLAKLRDIAKAFPRLQSFHCRFRDLSNVKASDPLSHQLKELSVNNDPALADLEQRVLFEIAHYLDSTFPNLKSINSETHDDKWRFISDLVKLCQAVRKDDESRHVLTAKADIQL